MEKLFEKALRKKLRFNYKGMQSVEDLWDMPLTALDKLYLQYKAGMENKSGSLLEQATESDSDLVLKTEIIKHIVETRIAERKAAEDSLKRKEHKQKILKLISDKQDEELRGKTIEDLTKMLDEM